MAIDGGNRNALVGLLQLLYQKGARQEAEQLAQAAADDGYALGLTALDLLRVDEEDMAKSLARAAREAGEPETADFGIICEEETPDGPAADEGTAMPYDVSAPIFRVMSFVDDQEWEEAERIARIVAKDGDTRPLAYLAAKQADAGQWDKAERLARIAAEANSGDALIGLAERWFDAGRWEEVERLVLTATELARDVDSFGLYGLTSLVERVADAGQWDKAERLARIAAEANSGDALIGLAERWFDAGRWEEVERLVLTATELARDLASPSFDNLIAQLADGGRWEMAELLARAAVEAGEIWCLHNLAKKNEQAGRPSEAERLYLVSADAGQCSVLGEPAAKDLSLLWMARGKTESAQMVLRFGLDADGRIADPW
ncbi:tetratricopeptide repeat protein [Microbispora rosea]|uniref:tetratricopeptide repeat protein n=1 Tax=Microbispora rosea TaxID=58117 RepID=UPI0036A6E81E